MKSETMPMRHLKGARCIAVLAAFAAAMLALTLIAGCAQNEPNASDMERGSATPSSGSTSAAVAESSSVNDMADGIATIQITEELKELKTAADVKEYVADLREDVDEESSTFDHADADSVEDANELVEELRNLNQYLPTLVKDEVITQDEANEYSVQLDEMLLTMDALIAV